MIEQPRVIPTRAEILYDIYTRASSRAFLLTAFVCILALLGWGTGNLAFHDAIEVILWIVGIFTGAERLSDAAGRFGAGRQPAAVANVKVDADG